MIKILSAIVFLMGFAFPGTASAITVNIGPQAGLYDISSVVTRNNESTKTDIEGTLAPHTSVTFTYSLVSSSGTDGYGPATLYGSGNYNFYQNQAGDVVYIQTPGYLQYSGGAFRFALQNQATVGQDSGDYGDPANSASFKVLTLLTSAADIGSDGRVGHFTISNTSDAVVSYATGYSSMVHGLQSYSYTYLVTPLATTVPLPAALPLFGGAMALFGAFRSKRKRS